MKYVKELVFINTILFHKNCINSTAYFNFGSHRINVLIDAKGIFDIPGIENYHLDNTDLFNLLVETVDFLMAQEIL